MLAYTADGGINNTTLVNQQNMSRENGNTVVQTGQNCSLPINQDEIDREWKWTTDASAITTAEHRMCHAGAIMMSIVANPSAASILMGFLRIKSVVEYADLGPAITLVTVTGSKPRDPEPPTDFPAPSLGVYVVPDPEPQKPVSSSSSSPPSAHREVSEEDEKYIP